MNVRWTKMNLKKISNVDKDIVPIEFGNDVDLVEEVVWYVEE